MSYNLAFQLVFYSRGGVVTLTDSIDANPAFGDCAEPAQSIENALREVCVVVCRIFRAFPALLVFFRFVVVSPGGFNYFFKP